MKIAIFGGAGFIGSWVVDKLLGSGYELNIFDHPSAKFYRKFNTDETVNWFSGDFQDSECIETALENVDAIIHLISTTVPKNSNDNPIFDVQTNLIPSINLFHHAAIKKVKKIIFISSGGTVYGEPHYLPIDENHPTNPRVSYGVTKLAIEKYLLLYQKVYGIQAIILRVSNPYGPRQNPKASQGVISHFIQKVLNDESIQIFGDGNNIRDYIHVSDVAEACLKALNYEGIKNIFNIGSGIGVSLQELIEYLQDIIPMQIRCNFLPARAFDLKSNILDIQLSKQELQWQPHSNIKLGLIDTITWLKEIIPNSSILI